MQWYVEHQVIFVKYWGEVTLDETRRQIEMNFFYNDQSTAPLVHAIIDLSGVTKPLNMAEMAAALKGLKPHPRSGWMITVGEKDPVVRFLSSVARQLFKLRQRAFHTFEEAVEFLKGMDTTIDWNKADLTVLTNAPEIGEHTHDH
jgi:hypothetical protein